MVLRSVLPLGWLSCPIHPINITVVYSGNRAGRPAEADGEFISGQIYPPGVGSQGRRKGVQDLASPVCSKSGLLGALVVHCRSTIMCAPRISALSPRAT
ncbi:hypothetical protein BD311DRAFT_770280 [Dichomitus squalens]|uniref:Uncharacterized protein n=1 Tax=Dichomitus squalens TaxID=114155 RepID=A0A4Q9M8L3_9APHY|nr:hypothetical protein BD311DRAFT_770280 [Dichomitus squalens]